MAILLGASDPGDLRPVMSMNPPAAAESGAPSVIDEHGPTSLMFGSPQDPRTNDYVNGRFG